MEGFALDASTGNSWKVSKEKSKLPNYDIQILAGCFEHYKKTKLGDGVGLASPPATPPPAPTPLNDGNNTNSSQTQQQPSSLIKDKLVIVINDFESFDPQLFHSFVNICSLYSDRIPFVFVIHLATSIESFRQVIPTHILAKMNFEKFQLVNNVVLFETLVQEVNITSLISFLQHHKNSPSFLFR